ncbi:DUF262 domain-containing protein [Aureitalea sp. L0-47]|uniref:DUF262 domain-containing protein n=1 Tax=Aureitalea sp. L0-47 TaxID=2816962 RepID=UPI00223783FB|nr:DUF262 domain-containing HNH endonuclease family protein [Aureitalea sp. L0-47]MCW5518495.1 DUF262 domain-containing protein [Aureitalea sp. L0-47]
MQSANKEILLSFFQNNYQFEIPFFQRSYVWEEENWELLLEHLKDEVEAHINEAKSEHFIGTIITKPLSHQNYSVQAQQLIDGQQRLTTIAIMIKALADTAKGEYQKLKSNLLDYICFTDNQDNAYFRIKHSKNDEPYFNTVMKILDDGEAVPEQKSNINAAYHFFFEAFNPLEDKLRDIYSHVLLRKMPVIAMFLDDDDDEQEIFDTINSLGVRLTISELLKNYIFRDTELQPHYERTWYAVFEEEEEDIDFWNEKKTSGRVPRTNLELLLYSFLIIETGKEVRLEKLFYEYKQYLKNKTSGEKLDFLKRLTKTASTYRNFPSKKQLNEITYEDIENRCFHVIEYLEITTVYPLLLYIYGNVEDDEERLDILKILESYLVRRLVCKLSTKNYNRFFIQLVNDLEKMEELNGDSFEEKLCSFEEDTNRFPNDSDFKDAFYNSYLYNKYAQEVLFIISLYKLNNNYSDVKKLSSDSYSVEHMMPKKWETHWKVAGMNDDQKAVRNRKLKTLGNLTLVTQQLNSKMRNSSWKKKKDLLKKYGMLTITTDYLGLSDWDEAEIDQRAEDLAETAVKIWE